MSTSCVQCYALVAAGRWLWPLTGPWLWSGPVAYRAGDSHIIVQCGALLCTAWVCNAYGWSDFKVQSLQAAVHVSLDRPAEALDRGCGRWRVSAATCEDPVACRLPASVSESPALCYFAAHVAGGAQLSKWTRHVGCVLVSVHSRPPLHCSAVGCMVGRGLCLVFIAAAISSADRSLCKQHYLYQWRHL